MADRRKPLATVVLRAKDGRRTKLELFAGQDFGQEQRGGQAVFRLRQDGRWSDADCRLRTFRHMADALADHLAGMLGLASGRAPSKPDLRRGQRVRVPNGHTAQDGAPWYDVTCLSTDPILAADGLWYVGVVLYGKGFRWVPCHLVLPKGESHAR